MLEFTKIREEATRREAQNQSPRRTQTQKHRSRPSGVSESTLGLGGGAVQGMGLMGSYFPHQGLNLCPLHWQDGV